MEAAASPMAMWSFDAIFREMQDRLSAAVVSRFIAMAANELIHCRVSAATKTALRTAAQRQQVTESALVKRMLELMLHTTVVESDAPSVPAHPPRHARLYVRLTSNDWAALRERAAGRNMAPASYASNVLRAHLQGRAPLPKAELAAVRASATELRAIGGNLNQLARVANQGGRVAGPNREDLRSFLKVCTGLRDHIQELVKANMLSWRSGDA